jgi:ADP-ribose pyrophosphatase
MDYFSLTKRCPSLFDNTNAVLQIISDEQIIKAWQNNRRLYLEETCLPENWADIGIVLDDPYIVILRDLVKFPDGSLGGYSRLCHRAFLEAGADGVVVLPEYQGKILLLNQYRHATRQWHYEVPRGFGEPQVSVEENARKEIMEEIGGEVDKLVSLGSIHSNTGYDAMSTSLFYAKLKTFGTPNGYEGIESFVWLTVKELEEWIANEKITDGFTIAAYTKAKLKGLI